MTTVSYFLSSRILKQADFGGVTVVIHLESKLYLSLSLHGSAKRPSDTNFVES